MKAHLLAALGAAATVASIQNVVLAQSRTELPGGSTFSFVPASTPTFPPITTSRSAAPNSGPGRGGLGMFVNGIGQLSLYNSMVAADFARTRQRLLENRQLSVRNHSTRRRVNQEARESQLQRRDTRISTSQVSQSAPPTAGPTTNSIDPQTGAIQWPNALMGGEYSDFRSEFESQFTPGTGTTTQVNASVRPVTQALKQQLKSQIREMKPGDYVTAKKFIDSLASEYDSRVGQESERLASQ